MSEDQQQTEGFVERLSEAFDAAPNTRGMMRRIAERCGVTEQAVGRWRRNGNVARDHLAALADELGVTTDWLLTGRGPRGSTERDRIQQVAPIAGDSVAGVDPERIGVYPSPGDPVVSVGYRGDLPVYGVRVLDTPDVCPRYSAGEVVVAVHQDELRAGFDVFVQWMEADGVHAAIRHLAWIHEREVALEPVVPYESLPRRIYLLDELGICDPIYATVAPWVVESYDGANPSAQK